MQPRVPGQRGGALVQARVVLHRARAEWIEARVEVEVALRQVHVVADDLGLAQLGQPRRLGAAEALREQAFGLRDVELGTHERAPPARALLEDGPRVALGAYAPAGVGLRVDARIAVQRVVAHRGHMDPREPASSGASAWVVP